MSASDAAAVGPRTAASLITPQNIGRVLFTLAALVVYRFGTQWPAPGIDAQATYKGELSDLARIARASSSIFALGVTPVFSVMLLAELAKLAFPTLRLLVEQRGQSRVVFNRIIIIAGLLLGAFQANGIATALQAIPGNAYAPPIVPEPGLEFKLGFIVTQVAGTAFLVWLADQITRHGIGSGFWILLLASEIGSLAFLPQDLGERVQTGQLASNAMFLVAGFVIAAVVALVALERARDHGARLPALSIWPVYIATSVFGLVMGAMLGAGIASESGAFVSWPAIALFIALIFAVTWLAAGRGANRAQTFLVALALTAICCGLAYISRNFQVPVIQGASFIAIVLVALSILPNEAAPYLPQSADQPENPT